MRENLPFHHRLDKPSDLQLFLIAESKEKRFASCKLVREILEKSLRDYRSEGQIKEYCVEIFDFEKSTPDLRQFSLFWDNVGNKNGKVYIPIFHNIDAFPSLPQQIFDMGKPGILSLSQKGYKNVINSSKRDCFAVYNN